MAERLRALLITPDYHPATGGIQTYLKRLADEMLGWEMEVVAAAPVKGRPSRTLAFGWMSTRALGHGLRRRPEMIVSGHVMAGPAAMAVHRVTGAPVVQILYGVEVTDWQRLTRWSCAGAQAVVCISRYTRELAIEVGVPPELIHLIAPGVDLPGPPPPIATRPPGGIIIVSRLAPPPYKGHEVLFRALPLVRAQVPEVQLTVVGDGPLLRPLQSLAAGLPVRFTGRISHAEREREMGSARVFCLPSRLSGSGGGEGFGIVYLEAGAHGVPAIGGNVGGACDAIEDGVTGLLIDPLDHVALASALVRLLRNEAEAQRMGDAGRHRATRYSWSATAASFEALLGDLLAARSRAS